MYGCTLEIGESSVSYRGFQLCAMLAQRERSMSSYRLRTVNHTRRVSRPFSWFSRPRSSLPGVGLGVMMPREDSDRWAPANYSRIVHTQVANIVFVVDLSTTSGRFVPSPSVPLGHFLSRGC